jgi:hypothetical protein
MVGLPAGQQPTDSGRRQPSRRTEELFQGWDEVAGGQPVQVQQRQHLTDLRALAAPGRQDHRAEPGPLAGHRIHPAVIDPRRPHRNRTRGGHHLTLARVAVAHHQAPAALITLGGVGGEIVVDLGLQGSGQHPSGTLASQPIQVHSQFGLHSLVSYYTQHCGVTLLAGVAAPVSHLGLVKQEGTSRSRAGGPSTTSGHTSSLTCFAS